MPSLDSKACPDRQIAKLILHLVRPCYYVSRPARKLDPIEGTTCEIRYELAPDPSLLLLLHSRSVATGLCDLEYNVFKLRGNPCVSLWLHKYFGI